MKFKHLFALAVTAILIAPCNLLLADFAITEAYIGLSGSDGTEDWFEVTNFGNSVADTGTLFYDDSSADPTEGGALDSFLLAPGESAVFLISSGPAEIDEFNSIWAGVQNVGVTAGGGGFGGGGDSIFLFDNATDASAIVDSVSYDDTFDGVQVGTDPNGTNVFATIQFDLDGNASSSLLTSASSSTFANDNVGGTNGLVRLVGDPAGIPEPSSAALLGLCGLGLLRRRR